MFQLIFNHIGDEVGSIPLCIEHDFDTAKIVAKDWIHSYISYLDKCEKDLIQEEEDIFNLSTKEKFLNEYTYASELDVCYIEILKIRTSFELDLFINNIKDSEILKNLFTCFYKISYSKKNGIWEENNGFN